MKYILFIISLINVLSSNINANNAIIKDMRDKSPTHIKKDIKKLANLIIQNRGKTHNARNIISQQNDQIIAIVIIFFIYHFEKYNHTKFIGLFRYDKMLQLFISLIISESFRFIITTSVINTYQAYIDIGIQAIVSTHFAFAPNITRLVNTNIRNNKCTLSNISIYEQ